MSEDSKAQGAVLTFADIAAGIVEDCLHNIIHELVLQVHRDEKLQRMQSAATVAEQAAIAEHQENAEKASKGSSAAATSGNNNNAQPVKIDTPAAVYDNGRVTLRGNPLRTTREIVCAHCKLPRLMYPIAGAGSQLPDLSKQYCTRHPFVSRPGHDIYNNPFPTDMAKTKKERELIKRQEKDNTPGSQDADGQENSIAKLAAGGKPASYIPWHTCPNCKRSLLITRFAQHAEKCLGIAGRQSSRNAMVKLNSQGAGSAATGNTPLGSRVGTPVPGSQGSKISPLKKGGDGGGEGEGANDEEEQTPKKVKKKSSYVKKADREAAAAAAGAGGGGSGGGGDEKSSAKGSTKILKLKTSTSSLGSSKRPPKDDKDKDKDGTPSGKREREKDGDGEEAAPRKKIKLVKSESNASELAEKEKEKDDQPIAAVGSPESTAS
ncbi:hypothetical protein B0J12DRAFT_15398 [Macrophomina phaseolina]|uniref:SAGA-associated factor 11 n=1 Tax=Macrophomina phaseolina TaxID=35725 RepID=A0ABQ8GUX2_9PEZI|nr:hypothetical protein B0J12DRAFT_15398 [Macrophomina phaseolina]